MELNGLKINFLGDSITEGAKVTDTENNIYWQRLRNNDGCIVRGYGVGGTRIAKQNSPSDNPRTDLDFIFRVDDMDPDADAIVVFGGTNDFGHGDAAMGKMDDRCDNTFYGALHTLYTKLINKYPQAQIIVMTPLHRLNEKAAYNNRGLRNVGTLEDYVNAIIKVAGYYSIPVLDLYRVSGMNPEVEIIREKYMPDGLHPSDAGQEKIYQKLKEFIKKL